MNNKIILFGHGGSYNHGCEAIVRSTAKILEKNKYDIDLYSNAVNSDKEFELDKLVTLHKQRTPFNKFSPLHIYAMVMRKFMHNDRAYLKTFFASKMDDVKNSLCISIGGDMYCYGKLTWLYYIHQLLKDNGNKTVLWGCSVDDGSFFKESLEDLKRYDLILTRETISYNLFLKHGLKNVKLYPDPAFVLDLQKVDVAFDIDKDKTVAINVSPLVRRYNNTSPIEENVNNLIKHILEKTDFNIVLVPHVNGDLPAEDDYRYLYNISKNYTDTKRVHMLGKQYNCMQLKYIVSNCRFLITARTHISIAAYSTFVPTVVLGYSVKARGIAQDIFGTDKDYVVPVQSLEKPDELTLSFEWLLENEEQIKKHLHEFIPQYKSKVLDASAEIEKLMGELGGV